MDWYVSSFRPLPSYVEYLVDYGRGLVTQEPAAKLGMGALLAVMATGREVYGEALAAVILFWAADMLLGMLRAIRDPEVELRWGKALDGILRLVVILIVPPIVHIAASFPDAVWEGFNLGDRPTLFVIGLLGAQEFFSVIDNAVFLVPGLERWKARIIRWDPDHPTPRMTKGEVMVVREEEDEDDDEDEPAHDRRKGD